MILKKFFSAAICVLSILFLFCANVSAQAVSDDTDSSYSDLTADDEAALSEYQEQVEDKLNDAIDDDLKEDMNEIGVNSSDASKLTLSGIIAGIWDKFTDALTEPLKTLGKLAAIIILTSAASSAASESGGVSQTFMTVSVLGCITVIYTDVYSAFESVCAFLDNLSQFMVSYIPIYAAVTAASGSFTTGGSYYAASLGVCELISVLTQKIIMPFLCVFLALSFTAAINPDLKFSSAAQSIKNGVNFTLTALMTIFTGLISVQSLSGAAADNAAAKAVKFGASNFIPIIGGSVSEAYSTVYSSIGIIRSSVGTIGILAVFAMLLTPLVKLIALKIILSIAKIVCDLLGANEASELLSSSGFAMSAAISTLLCFSLMFIVATAIVMLAAARAV